MTKSGRITSSVCDRRSSWCGRIWPLQLKNWIFWNNEHDSCSSHYILNITITSNCNYFINFLARRLLLVAIALDFRLAFWICFQIHIPISGSVPKMNFKKHIFPWFSSFSHGHISKLLEILGNDQFFERLLLIRSILVTTYASLKKFQLYYHFQLEPPCVWESPVWSQTSSYISRKKKIAIVY